MFGRRWSWSCWKCRSTYRFRYKDDSKVFYGALGGCCPRCGEKLSIVPLPDYDVPVPPLIAQIRKESIDHVIESVEHGRDP